MYKIIACLLVIMLLAVGTAAAAPAAKDAGLAFIDVKKIMKESPKVKSLQEQLDQKGREMAGQLEQDKANLTQDQYKERQAAVQNSYQQLKQDLEKQIDTSVKKAIEDVAQARRLVMVVYKDEVVYGGVDITDDVIARMQ